MGGADFNFPWGNTRLTDKGLTVRVELHIVKS